MRKILVPEWVTDPDVKAKKLDSMRTKRLPRPNNKVKRNEEIRALYRNGKTLTELSKMYGVSRQRIFQIINDIKKGSHDDNTNS